MGVFEVCNLTSPPMALINSNNEMSKSPQASCTIMSDTLSKLGGEMEYSVSEAVETAFLMRFPPTPHNMTFLPGALALVYFPLHALGART